MSEVIAQTGLSELLHTPGGEGLALLVFGEPEAAGWPGAAAAAAAAALGLEVFVVRPLAAHDFPPDDMQELLAALAARRSGRPGLVAIGGAGALRHAGASGAETVLTFAPAITSAPLPPRGCDVFMFVDADAPAPKWPRVQVVAVRGLQGDPAALLTRAEDLERLLAIARAKGAAARRAAALRVWARRAMRGRPAYRAALALRLERAGHLGWLAALRAQDDAAAQTPAAVEAEVVAEAPVEAPEVALLARVAAWRAAGEDGLAAAALAEFLAEAASPAAAVALAEIRLAAGDASGARAALALARFAGAAGATLDADLVAALRSRAEPVASAALADLGHAEALAARGDARAADEARLAVRAMPKDAAALLRLARVLAQVGDGGAVAALRAAVLVDGGQGVLTALVPAASVAVAPAKVAEVTEVVVADVAEPVAVEASEAVAVETAEVVPEAAPVRPRRGRRGKA